MLVRLQVQVEAIRCIHVPIKQCGAILICRTGSVTSTYIVGGSVSHRDLASSIEISGSPLTTF